MTEYQDSHFSKELKESDLYILTEFFKVLGNPIRIRILLLLMKQDSSVGDLAEQLGITQSAVIAENRLVFPGTVHNAVYDAVHADIHQLVQCRIFFQSNPSFCGVVAYLCFGGIASGKRKKPENHLVASDIF